MKKSKILSGMGAIAVFFICFVAHFAEADEGGGIKVPKEEMIIEGKKPARFNHQTHITLGVTCGECHHNADHQALSEADIAVIGNGRKLLCDSCHNKDFTTENLNSKKKVFHAKCKECHKTGFKGQTGPTKCVECHIEKKE